MLAEGAIDARGRETPCRGSRLTGGVVDAEGVDGLASRPIASSSSRSRLIFGQAQTSKKALQHKRYSSACDLALCDFAPASIVSG
jgi:hypothetical protein